MNKETLKKWRLIIPGIIILLFIIPGLTTTREELLQIDKIIMNLKWTDAFFSVIVVIIGGLYYALDIRWFVWKPFNTQVQENIKDKLLNTCDLELCVR